MPDPIHIAQFQPEPIAPSEARLAIAQPPGTFGHLASDSILATLLVSTVLLLFGVLLRLRQLKGQLRRESAVLRKNARQLQLMGDNLPNITLFQLIHEEPGSFRFTHLGKNFERAFGIDRGQILTDARLAFDHVYESDIPAVRDGFMHGKENLEPANLEIRILDVSGKPKWLHISAIPRREDGLLVWDGFIQDISAMKNIEIAVMEENRNFQNLFQTIDDFLVVCDMDGRLIHTNPSVEKRLRHSHRELETMSIFELYPPEARADIYQIVARMQSEQATTCSHPLQMDDGALIPVEMNFFQGMWKNRKVIFGVARDISRRQQTESALRESQRMLQLIIDTIPMPIFWKDKDSIYLGCNKSFIHECGMENIDDVVGKTPFDLFDPAMVPDEIDRDQQVIESNQALLDHAESHTKPDGSIGWREISMVPLHNTEKNAVGVLGVWRDVTEQNRAEERLKRTLEDMERFNQLMRGRERRTLELKAEINSLLKQLGKPGKYRTTMDDLP